jgi:hypothetical protein
LKFTFKEFRICVRAIFAFGAGYKLGERYRLGELERRRAWSSSAVNAPMCRMRPCS